MSTNAIADISIPPFKQIAWEEKTYKTTLPRPFGQIVIDLHIDESAGLDSMTVEFQGQLKKISAAYLEGVGDPGEPEVTIGDYDSQGTPKQFKVSFEYGVPQKKLMTNRGECSHGCYEWVRNSMVITVDRNYAISIEKYE